MSDYEALNLRLSHVETAKESHAKEIQELKNAQSSHHDRISAVENGVDQMRKETSRTCQILIGTDKKMTSLLDVLGVKVNNIELKMAESRGMWKAVLIFQVFITIAGSVLVIYQAIH